MSEGRAPEGRNRRQRQTKTGIVVSKALPKTTVIRVTRVVPHPLYVKTIKRSRKFMAHDERDECRVGDKVLIVETRPLSKRKRWKVVKVLERPA
jgi:small subunit ribosomal protein S17